MARQLYLLSIPTVNITNLVNTLRGNNFDPIVSVRPSTPISPNVSEITLSIDLQGRTHKQMAEGFFQLVKATQLGNPLKMYEERKFLPSKFFRFFRKYAKRKWVEGVALYLGTLPAVGGFELAEIIHKKFPQEMVEEFNALEMFLLSALPVVIHIFYNYALMPNESEVKLNDQK